MLVEENKDHPNMQKIIDQRYDTFIYQNKYSREEYDEYFATFTRA